MTDEKVRAHVTESAPAHSHEIQEMHFGEIKEYVLAMHESIKTQISDTDSLGTA